MAKYLKNNAGVLTEESSIGTSAGAADATKIPHLNASGVLDDTIINATVSSVANKVVKLNGAGKLDTSVLPTGIGADVAIVLASENLAAGDFVNIFNDAGTAKARKADATTAGKEAHGFVLSAVSATNNASVYFEGTNTSVTGQTPGVVFLGTTAGTATSTAPSGSGNVVQRIGFAISTTAINFQSNDPIVLI